MIRRTVKLVEVCLIRRGTTITKKQTIDGDVPVIGGGTKPTYFHNKSNRDQNCITISSSGASAGFVNKWNVPIFASDCSTVEPKDDKQLNKFIYYYLLSRQQFIYENFRSGAAQPHVYAKDLETLDYPIVPLEEQKQIVKKLEEVFREIDNSENHLRDRLRNLSCLFNSYIEEKLRDLKDSFPIVPLEKVINGVQYGTSKKCSKRGKLPVLRMGNMQSGKFDLNDLVFLDDQIEAEKYKVREFDVFFNRTNSPLHVGKAAIWEGQEKALFAGYLIRINYDKDKINPYFLNFYLNAQSTRNYGYSVMSESINQANINGTKLKQYPFVKADLDTQKSLSNKFCDLEKRISDLINLTKKSLELYGKLRKKILYGEFGNEES